MAAEEARAGDEVPAAPTDATADDAYRFLKWWAYLSYAIGALGILGAIGSLIAALLSLGTAGAVAAGAGVVPSFFQFGAAGAAFLVGAIVSLAFAVLYILIGRGVRRRSNRWWTIGMVLYGLGLVFSLVTFNLIGVILLAIGLFLGYQGRDAVEGSTPI